MSDIEFIIQEMTLEEKAALCTGASAWTTTPVRRLGVPGLFMADGPHGVRRVPDVHAPGEKSLPATCYPTASSLASTWNVELLYEMGQALAEECIALGVDVLLGPGNNMKRSPLCGRNFEYFSEDPYLGGEIGAALIKGVQSKGVGTSLKHYAANNQEYQRFIISAKVEPRTLREIYLPAFEKCVKDAKPWTVMCAYNKVNGTYASEHKELLTNILKEEWGFGGLVVSDWGAVHDRVAALKAGLDLEMPGPKETRVQAVIEAVKAGELDQSALDASVRRILGVVFKAAETPKGGEFDVDSHHALARRIAGEGMVLLKNNGILPLKGVKKIAVIGRTAKAPHYQGGGSSHINPTKVDVPYVELQKLAGSAELLYAEGYSQSQELNPLLIEDAVSVAQAGNVALLYIGLPSSKESEGYDRSDLDLTEQQVALIKAVSEVQPNCVVILNNGSALQMNEWFDDVAAVLEAWLMGQAGGGAIADILFGIVTPSGKLAETFPLKLSDTPAHINFPGGAGMVNYGEGIFIGYRYYDAKEMPVLFPFGYGLSYTTFEYSNPRVSARSFKDRDGLTVSVDVTNTGDVTGKEVVQVYVHDKESMLVRPPKELKGFAKLDLQPGETQTANIQLDWRAFAYFHPSYGKWITENGEFEILIGASSADIKFRETVSLESTVELPCILDHESTLREWIEDPRGKEFVHPIFQMIQSHIEATFGGDEGEDDSIGTNMLRMLMDMPLLGILQFHESTLGMGADEMVDMLLGRVHGTLE